MGVVLHQAWSISQCTVQWNILLSQQMLNVIKHITDNMFFFQEDSAQVHCACNTVKLSEKCDFLCFPALPGNAEAQVICGGIAKRLLIAYIL